MPPRGGLVIRLGSQPEQSEQPEHQKTTNLPTSVQLPWSTSIDLGNKQSVYHLCLSLLGDLCTFAPDACWAPLIRLQAHTQTSVGSSTHYVEVSTCYHKSDVGMPPCQSTRYALSYVPLLDLSELCIRSVSWCPIRESNSGFLWVCAFPRRNAILLLLYVHMPRFPLLL